MHHIAYRSCFFKLNYQKKNLYIDIKKTFSIKIRELNIKKYDVCEYAIILIYIFNENDNVILIRRKIHIIDDLSIKIFININIIKFKIIVLDINKDRIIIKFCESLYILMFIIIINF